MSLIYLTQGDSAPDLTLTLTDHDSGVPIDLTSLASSLLKFRAVNTTTVLQSIPLTVIGLPVEGKLKLEWPTGALNIDPGFYEGEVELTYTGPKVQTAYTHLRFLVQAQF